MRPVDWYICGALLSVIAAVDMESKPDAGPLACPLSPARHPRKAFGLFPGAEAAGLKERSLPGSGSAPTGLCPLSSELCAPSPAQSHE